MSEFDIDGTDTLICPHCGSDNGADDLQHSGRVVCDECGKEFRYEADYTVTYSTSCVEHDYSEVWRDVPYVGENRVVENWKARTCKRCGHVDVARKDEVPQ